MKVLVQGRKKNGQMLQKTFEGDLKWLDLFDQELLTIDLSHIGNLHYLVKLELSENSLTAIDLSPLKECLFIQDIELAENNLSAINLEPLANLKHLKRLNLTGNYLSSLDLTPLQNCQNFEKLDLRKNNLTSIDLIPLANCTKLQKVIISENQLSSIDLTPLTNCIHLNKLDLDNNNLSEINLTPLTNCLELKELYLKNNYLTSINLSFLNNNTAIEWLDLRNNQLERVNLSSLSNCINFKRLELEKNPLKQLNIAPLAKCSSLEWLNLAYDQLPAVLWNDYNYDYNALPTGLKPYQSVIEEALEKYKVEMKKREEAGLGKKKVSVVLLGNTGAGKTTFYYYLTTKSIVDRELKNTLGIIVNKDCLMINDWLLTIIDVGGQTIHRTAFWESALNQAHGVIYLIDPRIYQTPEKLLSEQESFDFLLSKLDKNKPILVLLNKADYPSKEIFEAVELNRLFNFGRLNGFISNINFVSAKFGLNVMESLGWFLDRLEETQFNGE